jgi:ATP-dependent Lon protease
MQESAMAALTFVRSNAEDFGLKPDFFDGKEIHVHVPAGSTPKDGPSAGITIASGMVSLFTGVRVRRDVAMTGEITLSGKVLPIGGIKEKVLAAYRYGIYNVILPRSNESHLEDVPEEVRRKMKFHYVNDVWDVLAVALEQPVGIIRKRVQEAEKRAVKKAGKKAEKKAEKKAGASRPAKKSASGNGHVKKKREKSPLRTPKTQPARRA